MVAVSEFLNQLHQTETKLGQPKKNIKAEVHQFPLQETYVKVDLALKFSTSIGNAKRGITVINSSDIIVSIV